MRTLFVTAWCVFLGGCATYVPPQQDVAVLVTRESMRTYRPLPVEERRVNICTMSEQTKAVVCR